MKKMNKLIAIVVATSSFFSCQKNLSTPPSAEEEIPGHRWPKSDEESESGSKQVYILSNQAAGNSVMVYDRGADGMLSFSEAVSTGGTGTGGGLGNQGALSLADLDDDQDFLLAVNAGSNSISSFKISGGKLTLKSTAASGGIKPVSITQYGNLVYVLNAGDINNISGFRLKHNGNLEPIPNSTRPLSAASTGPAQISFINNGKVLVVTEKATNKIITYKVNEWGIADNMKSINSSSATPFGFATTGDQFIYVSEAVGGAPGASVLSSYRIGYNGNIMLAKGSVGAGQSAACWVVLTNNGRFAYTTNTASNNVSNFAINPFTGNINVHTAIAASTGAGPIDAAVSKNAKFLYTLNAGSHTITVLKGANKGSLEHVQTVMGVPVGATGLVAR